MTERRDAADGREEATDAAGNEVEAAGETTAAAVVGHGDDGDDGDRPVGADTQVRVEGDAHPADG